MEDRSLVNGPGLRSESLPDEENEDGEMALPEPPCVIHPEFFFSKAVGEDGFPDERIETTEDRTERVLQAKKLCLEECPYRFHCLLISLEQKEIWGIWGGWQRTDRRDFKKYLLATGFTGIPTNQSELEWEVHFFEGTDPTPNGNWERPITFKYGPSGLEEPKSNSALLEEDDE